MTAQMTDNRKNEARGFVRALSLCTLSLVLVIILV